MAATLRCDTIQNASSSTANLTLDASGNATVGNTLVMGSSFKRNRIINGNFLIDQRNSGAAVTPTGFQYLTDRWTSYLNVASKITYQQTPSSTETGYLTRLGAGFTNYMGCTSTSSYSLGSGDVIALAQYIEGYNVADLGFGTSVAKSITVSFWVYSSLTGTFGGCLLNSNAVKYYPFSYTINAPSTWEYKTITIPGDTAAALNTTTGVGIALIFSLGTGSTYSAPTTGSWTSSVYTSVSGAINVTGTNGATFYITGVQLETGSVATPYERQIYTDQLLQCQRYYWKINNNGGTTFYVLAQAIGATSTNACGGRLPVTMRITPTVAYSGTLFQQPPSGGTLAVSSFSQTYGTPEIWSITVTCASGLTPGYASGLFGDSSSSITFSSEL